VLTLQSSIDVCITLDALALLCVALMEPVCSAISLGRQGAVASAGGCIARITQSMSWVGCRNSLLQLRAPILPKVSVHRKLNVNKSVQRGSGALIWDVLCTVKVIDWGRLQMRISTT
jgi:hypothetical protein